MAVPDCIQIFSALLTPTIATVVSFIAYQQWLTAQNKLKFDLFEKRLAIHKAASVFITSILISGMVKNEESNKFLCGTKETKWLLNEDIAIYFEEKIWNFAVELRTLDAELENIPVGDEKNQECQTQRGNN